MDEIIQPLNYSVRAIEGMRDIAPKLRKQMPKSARQIERVANLVEHSVKFVLPNCAELVDVSRITESHFDMLRLPYPVVVLEIPWKIRDAKLIEDGHMKETPSTRRIVIAWDEEHAKEIGLCPPAGEPGVWVAALYYQDEVDAWQLAPLAAFLPRINTVIPSRELAARAKGSESDQLVLQTLLSEGLATEHSRAVELTYRPILPEFCEAMVEQMGIATAMARLQLDVRDEVCALWEFAMTVNCVNVRQETIEPSPALNRKRIKNGKLPFFSYKVLQLPVEPAQGHRAGKVQLEGDRNGPRMHLRRGHPRRLPTGKMTYVRAAIIGSSQKGLVEKSYEIR